MSSATRLAMGTPCYLVVFAFVLLLLTATAQWTSDAAAQSSVRPPAGATTNVVPGRPTGPGNAAGRTVPPQLLKEGIVPGGTLGNRSQSDIWRQIREGTTGNVTLPNKEAGQLIRGRELRLRTRAEIEAAVQGRGVVASNLSEDRTGLKSWIEIRNGPLARYGLYAMGGMIALLAVFFLIRGRIRIEHGFSGRTVQRFASIERIGHWLLAFSFIVLALTGLNLLYGREFIIPLLGKEAYAGITLLGKQVHGYVAFAFMAGLILIFINWVRDNFPHPRDIVWLLKGGGLFVKGVHPSSKKFNAGQKIIFWLVILGGASISLSGIALMFPFETAMFAKTFNFLNMFGAGLPTEVSAMDEQKYASLWHSIMALFLICVILAHIYIGSIGMEGAIDAVTTGRVDVNWAREHHDIWAEEAIRAEGGDPGPAAAEPHVQPAE